MRISSEIHKPLPVQPPSPLPQRMAPRTFSVPDMSELEGETPEPAQAEPAQPQALSREQYLDVRKNIAKQHNPELTEQERMYLSALLGFGLAEKKVDLWFKGIQYTITLRNLDEPSSKIFAQESLVLENELKKQAQQPGLSPQDQDRLIAGYLVDKKRLWVSLAIQEIAISSPINKIFSKVQILEFLQLDSFATLLQSWGEEATLKLFEAYSQLSEDLKQSLSNPDKLVEDLKK